MPEFRLKRDGLQDKFLQSRYKIQIYGGGFGNGKTTAAVFKGLQIAFEYPGSNILMARSTYPKLNDTLRKEFIKWCPKEEIKSFPMSANGSNTCTLNNGTMVNFRYIAQQGKSDEASTSNLLSATYDLIVVDQMEDPEIGHKDFLDLLGRLRGSATYRGDDPTMPRSGPRWFFITVNPTRNWVYKELVQPLHHYKATGEIADSLLCVRDSETNKPVLKDGKPILFIDLVEGSTLENSHNLDADFIQTLQSTYRGQMKDRFIKGEWAAYEGLVYPQFNELIHYVSAERMRNYLNKLRSDHYSIDWVEGYDHGLIAPSCYLGGFVDPSGNIIVCDGFHRPEYNIHEQMDHIIRVRAKWGIDNSYILADPDTLRRKGGKGERISDLFWSDRYIGLRGADNDIPSGVTKLGSYLNVRPRWTNPFTQANEAPSIYFNSDLPFIGEEFSGYFWRRNSKGLREDVPSGESDHALDTLRYMLSNRPNASTLKPGASKGLPPWMQWHENDVKEQHYGR